MPIADLKGARFNYMQLEREAGERCDDLVRVHGLATNADFFPISHAADLVKEILEFRAAPEEARAC